MHKKNQVSECVCVQLPQANQTTTTATTQQPRVKKSMRNKINSRPLFTPLLCHFIVQ